MVEYSDVQLFVRPIGPDTKHEEVEEFFSEVGPIKELRMMPGYAFIEYETPEVAKKAFSDFIEKPFKGEKLQIEYAKKKPEYAKKGLYRAKVTNLPEGTAWQDFKDFIRDEVKVHPTFVRIPQDEPTICYLEFAGEDDLNTALEQLGQLQYKEVQLAAERDDSPYIASASRPLSSRRRRGGFRGGFRGRGGYRGGYRGSSRGYGYRSGPPPYRGYRSGPPPGDYDEAPADYDDGPSYRDRDQIPAGPRGYPPRSRGYPPRDYPSRGGYRDEYQPRGRSRRDGPPPMNDPRDEPPRSADSDYRSSRNSEGGYSGNDDYGRDRSPERY